MGNACPIHKLTAPHDVKEEEMQGEIRRESGRNTISAMAATETWSRLTAAGRADAHARATSMMVRGRTIFPLLVRCAWRYVHRGLLIEVIHARLQVRLRGAESNAKKRTHLGNPRCDLIESICDEGACACKGPGGSD